VPDLAIASRWHGVYAKHPTLPHFPRDPVPHVTAVTGVGGSGMTVSFGLAESIVAAKLDAAV
jgi:D-hydroxyproline dehydrogenase subunit beta